MFSELRKRVKKAGQPPGTPIYTGSKKYAPSEITVINYNEKESEEFTGSRLADCLFPERIQGVTWVNVEGLHDVSNVEELAKLFNLHPLTVEDILNVDQRPKVEEFEGYIFITFKVLFRYAKSARFSVKQLSIVLGKDFVLSFQELDTVLFDNIRERLKSTSKQRMREQGSDYLTYRLIDAIVDEYFSVLESLGDQLEQVEERVISSPTPQNSRTIYRLKQKILLLRKSIWPMREAISHLMHADETFISKNTRIYFRDVYDHTVQAIDSLEIFRDMLSSMLDMYLSSLTNRMNEIMKTLTIITTIFIPITAIASIYGMNFTYIPGLGWHHGYEATLAVMIGIAILMLIYFRLKKWI